MAGVWTRLAAIDWSNHAGAAWTAAKLWTGDGFTYLATLPRTCVLATAHAAMVCAWEPPTCTIPGFGPLAIAWGWLVLGVLLGVLLAILFMYCTGRVRVYPAAAAVLPALANLAAPQQQPAEQILDYILAGGRPALAELASATGMTEAVFLQRVFGANANQPQPANGHRRIPGTNILI